MNIPKLRTNLTVACILLGAVAAGGVNAQTSGNAPADQREFESRVSGKTYSVTSRALSDYMRESGVGNFRLLFTFRPGRLDMRLDGTYLGSREYADAEFGLTYARTGRDTGRISLVVRGGGSSVPEVAAEIRSEVGRLFSAGVWVFDSDFGSREFTIAGTLRFEQVGGPEEVEEIEEIEEIEEAEEAEESEESEIPEVPDNETVTGTEAERQAVTDIAETVTAATAANVASNIGVRFSAARSGTTVALGGRVVSHGPAAASAPVPADSWYRVADSGRLNEGRSLDLADVLGSSSFEIALDSTEEGTPIDGGSARWTVWGRGDFQVFESDSRRHSSYDGDLGAGYLGIDARVGERWVAGLAASVARAEADYSFVDDGGSVEDGRLELMLTSVHPYVRYAPDGGSELWAIFGAGQGELDVERNGATAPETSDVEMWMGSAGARRTLAPVGKLGLAVLGDVGLARVETDAGRRVVDGLNVNAMRARAGVEGSHTTALDSGTVVTPFVEVAGRYDGGDGEGEVGLEVSPGLYLSDPASRFGLEARGRVLALYSQEDYEEYGASVTASVSPGVDGRGLSVAVSPRWGTGSGEGVGMLRREGLWRDDGARRTGRSGDSAMSLDARAGYGVRAMRGLLTPFAEVGWRERESRRVRLGV